MEWQARKVRICCPVLFGLRAVVLLTVEADLERRCVMNVRSEIPLNASPPASVPRRFNLWREPHLPYCTRPTDGFLSTASPLQISAGPAIEMGEQTGNAECPCP